MGILLRILECMLGNSVATKKWCVFFWKLTDGISVRWPGYFGRIQAAFLKDAWRFLKPIAARIAVCPPSQARKLTDTISVGSRATLATFGFHF